LLFDLNEQLQSYDVAYNFLTIAVIENNPDAIRKMGEMYFRGDRTYGIEKDEEHGEFLLFTAATELNSVEANHFLRHLYLGGKGKNALSFFSYGQEKKDPQAIIDLSTMYEKGLGGVTKDLKKAHEILLAGSDAGLAEVSFHLAILHLEKSYITLSDFPKLVNFQKHDAYSFLIKAADQGHWAAALAVGKANLNHLRLPERFRDNSYEQEKSDRTAMTEKYLTMANNAGYNSAVNDLGMLQRIKIGLQT
jgi:TPR repeat protein